jgi:hypothetical protein
MEFHRFTSNLGLLSGVIYQIVNLLLQFFAVVSGSILPTYQDTVINVFRAILSQSSVL